MAIEIEKKYKVTTEERDRVISELKEAGAEFIREDFEENTIYGGGKLDEDGAVLRIRRTEDVAKLTYKKRIETDLPVKKQIEFESGFDDPEALENIIELLGFTPRLIYEKRRSVWKFRSVEVVIDELPFGLFVEIEGQITAIKEAEILLGMEDLEAVHETYPFLTMQLGKRNGNVVEARFEDNAASS